MIRGLKFTKFKGSEYSGHHGHAGRPGSVGGSAPSGSTDVIGEEAIRAQLDKGKVKPFTGILYHFTSSTNVASIEESGLRPSGVALLGEAIYLTANPDYSALSGDTFGNVRLNVKVDIDRVLYVGGYREYGQWIIDNGLEHMEPAAAFLSKGIQAAWFDSPVGKGKALDLAVFDPGLVKVLKGRGKQ